MDTKQANSKYYNPATWDPASADYQDDVRLSVRDELPDEMDASDIAESFYSHLFATELTWPPMFFGIWAAGEPDVSTLTSYNLPLYLAHRPLSLGEGPSESHVPWRTRLETLPDGRGAMHCLQVVRGCMPRVCNHHRVGAET